MGLSKEIMDLLIFAFPFLSEKIILKYISYATWN